MNAYELQEVQNTVGSFSLRSGTRALERGTVYAVTGPNGSGKTTLLNMLALLIRPDRGRLVFWGDEVDHDRSEHLLEQRRRIAYQLQNPYLFNMSVRDNIACGLRVRSVSKPEIASRVSTIMEQLLLSEMKSRNAHALSGGEVQRVALARTLVLDADVYLLDEPTANVDQRNVHLVEELILRLNRDRGATVILSTHSRDQAYRMSRRVISIIGGNIHDIAYENVFSGVLTVERDGLRTVALPESVTVKVGQGTEGPATLAIDPQDIILSRQELASSALNRFEGRITGVEDVNGSLRVFVDTGIVLCALVTRRSYVEMDLNVGSPVWVTFKANAVKVI